MQQLEVVFPDIMEINAELRSKLESLERELARIREQGLNQEKDRLRAQVIAHLNKAVQAKSDVQRMANIVIYLEKEEDNVK